MELERFKSTVIPLREKLQIFAKGILKNDIDAEDAVQETFLRLWNVRSQLNTHPNIGGFAMQTLKNICIDRLRSERYDVAIDNVAVSTTAVTPYTYTEQNDSDCHSKNYRHVARNPAENNADARCGRL